MNLLHIKYAVEIAETGSINKAAEKLLIGQPNLSRAIKELEGTLNTKIFQRSAKGMTLTPEGEVFMDYARNILKQVDAVEEKFKKGYSAKKCFSASVPRASYIAEAFSRFTIKLNSEPDTEIVYKETNSAKTLNNILQEDYHLGVIRYAEEYDRYYKTMLEEKKLDYELISKFKYVLIMSKECPLAKKDSIVAADLEEYVEIAHADPFVPSLPEEDVKRTELDKNIRRRIFVFERASQFQLLINNTQTFMFVSPLPKSMVDKLGLVQRECMDNERYYKDILIHRKGYTFSELDSMFIEQLVKTKREAMEGGGF